MEVTQVGGLKMHSVAEKKMWQNSTEGALLHLGDSMSPAILGYLAFHISRYYRVKAARQAPFPDNVDVPQKRVLPGYHAKLL